MVQIEAPSIPERQEVVPSPGGQQDEEHGVVHHVQGEQIVIVRPSESSQSIEQVGLSLANASLV